ncbi:MAG: glycosyltransferase [bacterium]
MTHITKEKPVQENELEPTAGATTVPDENSQAEEKSVTHSEEIVRVVEVDSAKSRPHEDKVIPQPVVQEKTKKPKPDFYFSKFENRKPPKPVPYSISREFFWQMFAVINLVLGAWYVTWRWGWSLNYDALWFALPLVIAETLAYIGLALFTFNLWATRDPKQTPPPKHINECIRDGENQPTRAISVDIFFPTYDEDPELVRLSIQDAKNVTYPHAIDTRIHVLDDGKREEMRIVTEEEGANYITRSNNIGFKAGNMRNALEQTFGDFIVICDADTRVMPTIIERTLGYFRDPKVAWVQTPQWFFDLPEGSRLNRKMQKFLGKPGYWLGSAIEKVVGPIKLGEDPFRNDPRMFYDLIQRRRNWANAAFCCGAGSIHRRDAVMEAALKTYADALDGQVRKITDEVDDPTLKTDLYEAMQHEMALETEVTPYKFHVSEDIYTSVILHSDPEADWKSVYHPYVESKMLSPQDLLSWTVQRFKYAGGTLDIAFHDNPLFRKGLTWKQRLMYSMTFYSYLGCLWNVIFIAAPIIYMFTGIPPVSAYSFDFFKHALPFFFMNELAFMIGTWGISNWGGRTLYLSFFPTNLKALWTVLKGEKIKFPTTPKDRQEGTFARLVIPQIVVMALTGAGIIFAFGKIALGYASNWQGLLANTFWAFNTFIAMYGIVRSAYWNPDE